ncbi:MAG: type 1 glutamine amidotransferase [Beutenbergiaceae bacterium]
MSSPLPRIAVIEHRDHLNLGLLEPVLEGCDVQILQPGPDQQWPALDRLDGLIVLGGRASLHQAGTQSTWLAGVSDYLKSAADRELPVLGICLGAQLVATALGGEVEHAAPGGPERGIVELRMRPEAASDALMGPVVHELGRDVWAAVSHEDAISSLPPGATWLASSRRYPFQAFRAGSAWGVQFHPEVDSASLAAWVARHGGDGEAVRAQYQDHAAQLQRLAVVMGEAFLRRAQQG